MTALVGAAVVGIRADFVTVTVEAGESVLLIGEPGVGKTMLARRFGGLLPPMTPQERMETACVHSVAGLWPHNSPALEQRPFRAPHYTVSAAGMLGGGILVRPGEVSLAHNGVLFLDDLPEFSRSLLDALREPLETGRVMHRGTSLPAKFRLVAAMNPCPCNEGSWQNGGWYCDRCGEVAVARYLKRVPAGMFQRVINLTKVVRA